MWNHIQYKQTGKAVFLANYWPAVGVSVILTLSLIHISEPTRPY